MTTHVRSYIFIMYIVRLRKTGGDMFDSDIYSHKSCAWQLYFLIATRHVISTVYGIVVLRI